MKAMHLSQLDETTEELDLSEQVIQYHEWELLSNGLNLKKLDLSVTNVTDEQTHFVAQLTHLQDLDISDTSITDLSFLKGFDELEILDIIDNHISILPVKLPSLKHLHASCTDFTDLNSLDNAPNLHELYFEFGKFSDLTPLARQKNLIELDLYGCKNVIEIAPITDLQKLKRLCLSYIGHDNPDHLAALGNLISLEELSAGNTHTMETATQYMLDVVKAKRDAISKVGLFSESATPEDLNLPILESESNATTFSPGKFG